MLKAKSALVTGATSGIGHAIARALAAEGCNIVFNGLGDGAEIEALRRAISEDFGIEAVYHGADLARPEEIPGLIEAAEARFGRLDILVNNAGISGPNKKTWEYTPQEWHQVISVDLTGVFLCCRAVVPVMRENGYGRIVNIASIAGKEGNPNAPAYSAAKAGVIGLTKSLAKELALEKIHVNCVTPAVVKTAIFDQMSEEHIEYMLSRIPMARFGGTTEVAALVAWLCSEECSFSTGAVSASTSCSSATIRTSPGSSVSTCSGKRSSCSP